MMTNEIPYAGVRPKIRKRKKVRAKSRTQGISVVYVLACVTLLLTVAFLLYRETEATVLSRDIAALKVKSEEMVAKRDAILRELSPYMAQDRVEKVARDALAMDYPTSKQTVRVAVEGGAPVAHEEVKPEEEEPSVNVLARILALLFDGRDKV